MVVLRSKEWVVLLVSPHPTQQMCVVKGREGDVSWLLWCLDSIFLGVFLALKRMKQLLEMPWWVIQQKESRLLLYVDVSRLTQVDVHLFYLWKWNHPSEVLTGPGLWWLSVDNARTLLRDILAEKILLSDSQLLTGLGWCIKDSLLELLTPGTHCAKCSHLLKVSQLSHCQRGDGHAGMFLFLRISVIPAFAFL